MKNLMLSTFLVLVCLYSHSASSETVYVHSDILGSPIMETNSSGTVTSRSHYKPFGEALEGMKKGVGYTGHLNDKDLKLTYMQARYYDPVIGRFYSNDPVSAIEQLAKSDIHGFNRYAYANNNPYKYTDPDGKDASLQEKPKQTADPSDNIAPAKGTETTLEITKTVETVSEADAIESSTEQIEKYEDMITDTVIAVGNPLLAPVIIAKNALPGTRTKPVHKGDKISVAVKIKGTGMTNTSTINSTTSVEHDHEP